MPAFLAPLLAGGASLIGGLITNRANAREAEKNRQFQEEMSSTSAQRGVRDYAAAGLNPALAYDRGASSPGGAQAQIGDAFEKGVSSAMAYRAQRLALEQGAQQMQIAADQSANDTIVKREQAGAAKAANAAATAQAQLNYSTQLLTDQNRLFQEKLNPKLLTSRDWANSIDQSEAKLRALMIPGASNAASWERMIQGTPNNILRGLGEAKKFIPNFRFK